jgi:hypothetical protein
LLLTLILFNGKAGFAFDPNANVVSVAVNVPNKAPLDAEEDEEVVNKSLDRSCAIIFA